MNQLSRLTAVFIFVLPLLSYGQVPEICNAALSSGIRDNYYVLTERDQYEQYQKRLCDAKFSSYGSFQQSAAGFKLDAPLADGLLGLSGTSEQKSSQFQQAYANYCSSTFFNSQYRERFSSYSNQVSTALTNSWLECQKTHVNAWLAANQKGVFIAATPQDNFTDFTISVFRKVSNPKTATVNDLTPAGTASCTRKGKIFGTGTVFTETEFQLTCSKPAHRQVALAIDISDGVSNTVILPASTSKLAELNDRLTIQSENLRKELEGLRQALLTARAENAALTGTVNSHSTGIAALNAWATAGSTFELVVSYAELQGATGGCPSVEASSKSCATISPYYLCRQKLDQNKVVGGILINAVSDTKMAGVRCFLRL